MTAPPEDRTPPENQTPERPLSVFKGRRITPLLAPWISSLIFAGLVYYAETTLPALKEVARLIYVVLALIVFVATARWLRVRSHDRRARDRRQSRS
jgi:uncharacterized membrane protein